MASGLRSNVEEKVQGLREEITTEIAVVRKEMAEGLARLKTAMEVSVKDQAHSQEDIQHELKGLLKEGATLITLLPGSRLQEVTRMLPIFLQTMELISDGVKDLAVIIPVAPNHHVKTYIEKEIQSWSLSASTILICGASTEQKYDAYHASRAAICTSGSAVMELQLAGLPSVVAYRAHLLTEWIIRLRTTLQYISLPNILLDSQVIPEALFQECTSKNLVAVLSKIIQDDSAREKQIASFEKVFRLLYNPLAGIMSGSHSYPSIVAASTILQAGRHQ